MKNYTTIRKPAIAIMLLLLSAITPAFSQVGINTIDPDPSSMLDIKSTERGLLVPRLTASLRQSLVTRFTNPANSLLVFDTNHDLFYFYDNDEPGLNGDGGTWKALNAWTLKGTYSATNNNSVFFMGNVGIGMDNPSRPLEINGAMEANTVYTSGVISRNGLGVQLTNAAGVGILVSSSGSVGINDKTPDDWLDVNGNINAEGYYKMNDEAVLFSNEDDETLFVGIGTGKVGDENTFVGVLAGANPGADGEFNTYVGNRAGENVPSGWNTCVGSYAGSYSTGNGSNVYVGRNSGVNTDGQNNVCVGSYTGRNNTGSNNVYLGSGAPGSITGSNNIAIGSGAGFVGDISGSVVIGSGLKGTGPNQLFIGNGDYDSPLIAGDFAAKALIVNGSLTITDGCTGCASDSTLKENIQPIVKALDKISRLQAYSYTWKKSTTQYKTVPGVQIGFMAQEVQKEFPTMVDTASAGYLYIDYQKMVVPLLISVKELKTELDQKDQKIKSLEERLARIEKLLLDEETSSSIKNK